ncbi:MAG: indole-3-glycerol phosphate synthase TrpC [Gemmatimonadota bacterium]
MLDRIIATKRVELEGLRPRAAELRAAARDAAPAPDFERALRAGGNVAVITEVKRRSPSAGEIRGSVEPADAARGYERGGAAAISVLTDRDWFGGELDDLRRVRAAVSVPVLRKDFTIDELQIVEARAAGASAVLLIVRVLADPELGELHGHALDLGMSVLVEVHNEAEVDRALRAGARIIGVNNRDLATFTTDLANTERLAALVPPACVLVGESGIRAAADVARLAAAGVSAVLVGESLMRSDNAAALTTELASVPRRARA